MEFPGVEEIEDLQPDEGVEDDGEVPGIVSGGLEGGFVVFISIDVEEPSAADITSYGSISPFVLRVCDIDRIGVVGIHVLWDELLTHEDENKEDYDLENGLSYDVFEHGSIDDTLVSSMGFSV